MCACVCGCVGVWVYMSVHRLYIVHCVFDLCRMKSIQDHQNEKKRKQSQFSGTGVGPSSAKKPRVSNPCTVSDSVSSYISYNCITPLEVPHSGL